MILVTSANGNQGRRLIPKLLQRGRAVRACVRTETSADALRAVGVKQVYVGDLADPAFIAAAMTGIATVYHVGPTLHPAERTIGMAMVDAARAAGVGHFVLSSVLHAITTDLVQHEIKRDIEEHLLSSGIDFTILQPANYMLGARLIPAFEHGVFRLPWSLDRRQSMVDLDDVAEVAALVLDEGERHFAATYELAGPGRYTAHDIARLLAELLGRPVAAERLDLEAFVRQRFGDGDSAMLAYQLRVSRAIEARYSSHDFIGNANVLGWLLGRVPTDFAGFAQKELAAYQAAQRPRR